MTIDDFEIKVPTLDYKNFEENKHDYSITFHESFRASWRLEESFLTCGEKKNLDLKERSVIRINTKCCYFKMDETVKVFRNFLKETFVEYNLCGEGRGYYANFVITAVETQKIFNEIIKLQEKYKELFVTTSSLFKTLTALTAKKYCTDDEADEWKKSIRNRIYPEECELISWNSIETSETELLSLALYYRQNDKFDDAIRVLWRLNQVKSLHHYFDEKKFFNGIEKVKKVYLFWRNNEEVQELLLQSTTLKELTLWTYTVNYHDTAKNITRFLKESSSLTELLIRKEGGETYPSFFEAVEEGLKENKSIQKLDLLDLNHQKSEVIRLLKAIKNNKESRVQIIRLPYVCENIEEVLSELLLAKPQTQTVYTYPRTDNFLNWTSGSI